MIIAGPWELRDGMWQPPDCGQDAVVLATLDLADTEQQQSSIAGAGPSNRGCGLWMVDGEAANVPADCEILSASDDWTQPVLGPAERSAWRALFNNPLLPDDVDTVARAAMWSLTNGSDPDGAGTRPLWPEKRPDGYYLAVHFGGQTIDERFGRGHAHAFAKWVPQIQSILRSEVAVDETQAAKWLGWLCKEIEADTGTSPNLATLLPPDLLANGFAPLPPGTTVNDDFSSGANWDLTTRGTFTVAAGVLTCSDVSTWPCATCKTTFSGSNHTAYATISLVGSSGLGVWVRRTTNTGQNEGYIHYWAPTSLYRIARFVGGTPTIVASGSVTGANGDVLKGDSNGSTHTVYQNGTQRAQGTDTTYPTGSLIGLGGQSGTRTYDNFNGTDGVIDQSARLTLLGVGI